MRFNNLFHNPESQFAPTFGTYPLNEQAVSRVRRELVVHHCGMLVEIRGHQALEPDAY